ncbi:MAG: PDZ domain-containing protein [Planctomycetota bacterium]
MKRLFPWFAAALLAVGAGGRRAGADEADGQPHGELVAQAAAWWEDEDVVARGAWALRLIGSGATAREVAAAVDAGRAFKTDVPKGTIHAWKRAGPGGKEHTCYLVIPNTYDPATPMKLLVWLHGGVARDEDGGGATGLRLWAEKAAEEGFLLLCPSGRLRAEWWTPGGVGVIRGALADVRRSYNVDADRIACGGFSDGASGCFHLLLHHPEPFCCFLVLMGQPLVTRLMGGPSAAANAGSRPVWAIHGGKDTLYPTERLQPLMDELEAAGCDLTWSDRPDTGHDFTALPGEWEAMKAFWDAHPRALKSEVRWQSSVPWLDGRCDWVEVMETAVEPKGADGLSTELLPIPAAESRPRLGVTLDTDYAGPGVRIREVEPGSAAAKADVREGDVLVEVEGQAIRTAQDLAVLREVLDTLSSEDRDGVFVFERDGERVEVKTRPAIVASDLEPRQPQGPGAGDPAGVIEARIVARDRIEIRTTGVKRLRLHLSAEQIDLDKPLTVVINGKTRYEAVPREHPAYVLTEAWRDGGIPRYRAQLVLVP